MRDRLVDAMVEAAKACAPGCGGTKADAVKAVRMCLDILELMKLASISQSFFFVVLKVFCFRILRTINYKPFAHSS